MCVRVRGAGVCREEGVGEWANAVVGIWCGAGRVATCIQFLFSTCLRFGFGAFRASNRVAAAESVETCVVFNFAFRCCFVQYY